jgi:hypothetical protein
MKILALVTSLVTFPVFADTCEDLARVALAAAEMRDAGVPFSKAMNMLDQIDMEQSEHDLLAALTAMTYSSDRTPSAAYMTAKEACEEALGDAG